MPIANYFIYATVQVEVQVQILMSIAILVYEVHFIFGATCCNTTINEHGAFFKVVSEVTVSAVLLLPPSSQCFDRCF